LPKGHLQPGSGRLMAVSDQEEPTNNDNYPGLYPQVALGIRLRPAPAPRPALSWHGRGPRFKSSCAHNCFGCSEAGSGLLECRRSSQAYRGNPV